MEKNSNEDETMENNFHEESTIEIPAEFEQINTDRVDDELRSDFQMLPRTNTPTSSDEARLLLALVLAAQAMMMDTLENQQAILITLKNCVGMLTILATDVRVVRLHPRKVWRLHRELPYVDRVLMNCHSDREFKRRMRVGPATFFYICALLAPEMNRSKRGGGIPLEIRVACALNRLGTGNYLLSCADLYGISEGTACKTVNEFCDAVLKVIRPLVVPHLSREALPTLAAAFEEKQGIPFIMGAIDGSHIPIIAPEGDPVPFYNRKGFYSVLLQGIVDMKTIFYDWDVGWAGSLHDYTLFVNSYVGRKLLRGDYKPYKLIGDAAYPYRTSMYIPFKGSKENLPPYMAHWNFIQSSTRMCVERAFGILKGRWRILLRRIEMQLDNVPAVVGACICLHNLCVMQGDFGDEAMVEESKKWLQQKKIEKFGDLKDAGTFKILEYGQTEVHRSSIPVEELIKAAMAAADNDHEEVRLVDDNSVRALRAGVTMHQELARTLFLRHLREDVSLPEAYYDSDDEGSSDMEE